jgi:hypothetical protein
MTVAELIKFLQEQPQEIQVAYRCYSEKCLLDLNDIVLARLCEPRPDGWIQNKRTDMPTQVYLVFPGN